MFGWYMDVNPHRLTATGLSAITILIACSSCLQTTTYNCDVFQISDKLMGNCSNLSLREVPQNLTPDIEVLEISYNPIQELNSQSFARYKKLFSLQFVNKEHTPNILSDTFISIKRLRILSLDGNDLSQTKLSLPVTLVTVTLSATKIKEGNVDFTTLKELNHLDIVNNLFESLPELNKFAELSVLLITGNPLKKFSAKQIARYCTLNILFISDDTEAFTKYPCECLRLKTWAQNKSIMLSELGVEKFNCPSGNKCTEKVLITPRMKELYENCRKHNMTDLSDDYDLSNKKNWKRILLIALGILIVFAILTAVVYWRIMKKSSHENDEENNNFDEENEGEDVDLADESNDDI